MRAVSWTHEPYHDLEQGRLPAIESLDAGFRKRSHRVANIATQDALATCGNAFAFEKKGSEEFNAKSSNWRHRVESLTK